MTWRCDFRIFKHSREESKVEGDPFVKLSAKDERRLSVPSNGRRKSVDGREVKRRRKVGSVKVDNICM
jgi:hypothetical protein